MEQNGDKVWKETKWLNAYLFKLSLLYVHTLVKLKLLKLTLIGAFGAGVVAKLIAKELRKKKKTEDIDD